MKIFLIIDEENCPGRVIRCFSRERDAIRFMKHYSDMCSMQERALFDAYTKAIETTDEGELFYWDYYN